MNTRAATSSRLVKKEQGWGDSHSKCVFTSDRVMTNNGALLDAPFQDSTQRDVREKRSGMTDDRGHQVFSREEGGRGTGSSRGLRELVDVERMKEVSFHSRNSDLFLARFILEYLYLFIAFILFYYRIEKSF